MGVVVEVRTGLMPVPLTGLGYNRRSPKTQKGCNPDSYHGGRNKMTSKDLEPKIDYGKKPSCNTIHYMTNFFQLAEAVNDVCNEQQKAEIFDRIGGYDFSGKQ